MGRIRLVVDCSTLEAMGLWDTARCCDCCHSWPVGARTANPYLFRKSYPDYDLAVCCGAWDSQYPAFADPPLQLASLSVRAILRALGLRRYPGNGRVIPRDYQRPIRMWCEPPLEWDGDELVKA